MARRGHLWRRTLLLAAAAAAAGSSRNGLGRSPLMGWSTWCTSASCDQGSGSVAARGPSLHDFCDEALILSVAAELVSGGLAAAGYDHVLIDDCWGATNRSASGELQGDPARFPHGMAWLTEQVHALGLRIGLYTSVGPTTCSSGNRSQPIPGSYGHMKQDAATLAAWQIDEVTMDWCDWHFNQTVLLPTVETARMSDALNATGRQIWFLFHCVGYDLLNSSWCAELGNSYTIWSDHHDNWNTTISIFFFLAWHPDFVGHATDTWPDPDFLMTGGAGCDDLAPGLRCPGMTDDEYLSEFTLWSLCGGQLVVATDIRNMSALQRKVLFNAELLRVFNDSGLDLGSLVRPAPDALLRAAGPRALAAEGAVSVWSRTLADGPAGPGACAAVALLNGGDEQPAAPFFLLEWLGLPGWGNNTVVTVRDLWAHADLPDTTGSFSQETPLAPHSSLALLVCAVTSAEPRQAR